MRDYLCYLWTVMALSCLLSCDLNDKTTLNYSIENQTGVPLEIRSFDRGRDGTIYDGPKYIYLRNGEKLTRTERMTMRTADGYDFTNFYGGGVKKHQTIEVIFNKAKKSVFIAEYQLGFNPGDSCRNAYYETVFCTYRNPLRMQVHTEDIGKFIFTEEDYQNAQDCQGNCE